MVEMHPQSWIFFFLACICLFVSFFLFCYYNILFLFRKIAPKDYSRVFYIYIVYQVDTNPVVGGLRRRQKHKLQGR